MEEYINILKDYLNGRRNIKKALYKVMSTAYRAVQNGRMTWDDVIYLTGGTN
jgi:hypothetical protein